MIRCLFIMAIDLEEGSVIDVQLVQVCLKRERYMYFTWLHLYDN